MWKQANLYNLIQDIKDYLSVDNKVSKYLNKQVIQFKIHKQPSPITQFSTQSKTSTQTMSLSLTVPQLFQLPQMFSEQFISHIQQQAQTQSQLANMLSSYSPNFPPSRVLPIVKEEYFKSLVKKQFVQQAMIYLYSFMTGGGYAIEQKHCVFNFVYKLVYLVSEIGMSKERWKAIVEQQTLNLANKFTVDMLNYQQQHLISKQKYSPPMLSSNEANELLIYIRNNILPFYQLWEKLLDQNKQFNVISSFYQPIKQEPASLSLITGRKLQIQELLSVDVLKQYFGEKMPNEEKKDPKKK